MSAKIIKFEPETVGEGYRFDPDEILDGAKGQGFTTLAVLGQLPNGSIWVSGSANLGETIVLIEKAKHDLLFSDDD